MRLKEIVLAIPALSKLATADLRLKTAYTLKKTTDILQKEADFFAQERQKIFEKYGEMREDGSYTFSGENEPQAIAELDALLELEVSPEVEKLDIPITENIQLSVNDVNWLTPFIYFTEE